MKSWLELACISFSYFQANYNKLILLLLYSQRVFSVYGCVSAESMIVVHDYIATRVAKRPGMLCIFVFSN